MVTVAVDAGGADLGPREVAAGAARAAASGIQVLLFGDASQIGRDGDDAHRAGDMGPNLGDGARRHLGGGDVDPTPGASGQARRVTDSR